MGLNFKWPEWLPCQEMTTQDLLDSYKQELIDLKGRINLIAGGPPCQGFSLAGLRDVTDPRNLLSEEYIEIVSLIQPKFLLLENVKGFQSPFPDDKEPYSAKVSKKSKASVNTVITYILNCLTLRIWGFRRNVYGIF